MSGNVADRQKHATVRQLERIVPISANLALFGCREIRRTQAQHRRLRQNVLDKRALESFRDALLGLVCGANLGRVTALCFGVLAFPFQPHGQAILLNRKEKGGHNNRRGGSEREKPNQKNGSLRAGVARCLTARKQHLDRGYVGPEMIYELLSA